MFFTYLRRELRRRRKAALVVASGLALGIALVIVVTSVSAGMKRAQDDTLESLYGLGTDMTVTKAREQPDEGERPQRPSFDFGSQDGDQSQSRLMVQGFQTLSATTVATVEKQKDVAQAVGGLSLTNLKLNGEFQPGQAQGGGKPGGGAPGGGGGGTRANVGVESFSVFGTDVAKPALGPLTSSVITKGRTFKTTETDARSAVLDSAYAGREDLAVGDTVTLKDTKFTVVGIATADSGSASADVYVPLKRAQTLSDSKDKITTVYVHATDSKKVDAVKSAIQKEISGTTVTTSSDLAETVSGSLSTASDLAGTVGKWLSALVLAAAFLVAGLLTSSAVSRRVREFGTLKALGWRSGRVTRQVAGEALVNGLLGGALGIALGLGGAYLVTTISPTLTAELGGGPGGGGGGPGGGGFGGGMRAGAGAAGGGARQAASRTLDVALSAPVSAATIAIAVLLAVAGGLVAGGFGGWRASRLRPADALRRVE